MMAEPNVVRQPEQPSDYHPFLHVDDGGSGVWCVRSNVCMWPGDPYIMGVYFGVVKV